MSQRVVLDTNCVISALLFTRQGRRGCGTVGKTQHHPLASKDTVRELIRALAYPKFKLNKAEQALLLADFLPYTETVVIEQIPDDLPIIRDPADQNF